MEDAQCFTFKNVLTVPFIYFLPIAVLIGFPFFFYLRNNRRKSCWSIWFSRSFFARFWSF